MTAHDTMRERIARAMYIEGCEAEDGDNLNELYEHEHLDKEPHAEG